MTTQVCMLNRQTCSKIYTSARPKRVRRKLNSIETPHSPDAVFIISKYQPFFHSLSSCLRRSWWQVAPWKCLIICIQNMIHDENIHKSFINYSMLFRFSFVSLTRRFAGRLCLAHPIRGYISSISWFVLFCSSCRRCFASAAGRAGDYWNIQMFHLCRWNGKCRSIHLLQPPT